MTGLLQFSGTAHAGVKLLSLTTTQRDALTPANGMIVYNSTDNQVQGYVASAWGQIGGGGSQTPWTSDVNAAGYKLIGNTTTTGDLTLQTTSGIGTTGADMHFLVGNNGATEAMTILNSGNVGIGTMVPSDRLEVKAAANDDGIRLQGSGGANLAWLHQQSTDAAILRMYDGGTEKILLNSNANGDSYFN